MKTIVHLTAFIKNNSNWKELLEAKPYSLKIKQQDNLYMFSYNMIESDFTLPVVQASRGTILEITNDKIKTVCHAFDKFFNVQETNAAPINYDKAYIREKKDGSLIRLFWYKDKWRFATNNGFDCDAELPGFMPVVDEEGTRNAKTFQDLIDFALTKNPIDFEHLCKGYCYMMELVSPRNRIVVPYKETQLWLLGARCLDSDNELQPELVGWDMPYPEKVYVNSIDAVNKAVTELSLDKEGYVVVDEFFNRVKVKTLSYVTAHHIKGEQQLSMKHLFESVKNQTSDDIKALFKEYIPLIEKVESFWSVITGNLTDNLHDLRKRWETIQKETELSQQKKQFALLVMSDFKWMSSSAFELCKNKTVSDIVAQFMTKVDYDGFKALGFEE